VKAVNGHTDCSLFLRQQAKIPRSPERQVRHCSIAILLMNEAPKGIFRQGSNAGNKIIIKARQHQYINSNIKAQQPYSISSSLCIFITS